MSISRGFTQILTSMNQIGNRSTGIILRNFGKYLIPWDGVRKGVRGFNQTLKEEVKLKLPLFSSITTHIKWRILI